jgi:hypothetical protein
MSRTSRRPVAGLAAGLLLVAAACAERGTDTGDPGPPPTDPSSVTTSTLPTDTTADDDPDRSGPDPVPDIPPSDPEGPAVVPEPVEPSGSAGDSQPTPIDNVVSDPGSSMLEVWFWNGVAPCATLDRVEVEERPAEVRITVFVGSSSDAGSACPTLAKLYSTTVALSSPLGARAVDDGATR